MEPWQQRVVAEKSELDGRIARLESFLATDDFLALDQRDLMSRQLGYMKAYSDTLRDRIESWSQPNG